MASIPHLLADLSQTHACVTEALRETQQQVRALEQLLKPWSQKSRAPARPPSSAAERPPPETPDDAVSTRLLDEALEKARRAREPATKPKRNPTSTTAKKAKLPATIATRRTAPASTSNTTPVPTVTTASVVERPFTVEQDGSQLSFPSAFLKAHASYLRLRNAIHTPSAAQQQARQTFLDVCDHACSPASSEESISAAEALLRQQGTTMTLMVAVDAEYAVLERLTTDSASTAAAPMDPARIEHTYRASLLLQALREHTAQAHSQAERLLAQLHPLGTTSESQPSSHHRRIQLQSHASLTNALEDRLSTLSALVTLAVETETAAAVAAPQNAHSYQRWHALLNGQGRRPAIIDTASLAHFQH